jgi:methylenetetrahydrofolate dehydrogenase (NADP+) / methenyltetrahydrofolate cyclohydrolase / formyltetrahydrofolate synthetase
MLRLSGRTLANTIYDDLKKRIELLSQKNIVPGLGVILVGNRPDSQTYVNMKTKKCKELGIHNIQHILDDKVEQHEIINVIEQLNNDPNIHGILIQLPLPKHINESEVLNQVRLDKDVDGFHHTNVGLLTLNQSPHFVPCTPDGCMKLIKSVEPDITGKHAVVLGRSRIVGMPMAMLLIQSNATVTICHSRTQNVENIIKNADIVIAACGQSQMVKGEWLKDNAIVIDVGINSIEDKTRERGYRLVGDVDYDSVQNNIKAITPVPGGVGPMTIAMLMEHTVRSAERSL